MAAVRILFHRDYQKFQGGHLKVFHYFNHVKATPEHDANIFFTPNSIWDETNPWTAVRQETFDIYDYQTADVLFLAGHDWLALPEEMREKPSVPVLNFLQGFGHTSPQNPLFEYLTYPAIRITVSEQVRDAVLATGCVNGPVISIPNGLPIEELPRPVPWQHRDVDVAVCALKNPSMGGVITNQLRHRGYTVRLLQERIPRKQYLSSVSKAKVAILIPSLVEGFYLPALEAMALEVLTVCPDCIGNRSFCRAGETAEMPPHEAEALVEAAHRLLIMDSNSRRQRQNLASEMSRKYSLVREREAFQSILQDLRVLWSDLC